MYGNSIPFLSADKEDPGRAMAVTSESTSDNQISAIERRKKNAAATAVSPQDDVVGTADQAALEVNGKEVSNENVALIAAPRPVLSDSEILQSIKHELNSYKCSAMTAALNGGRIDVVGYLKESTPARELNNVLLRIAGDKKLNVDVKPLTSNMCNIVDIYRQYWIANKEANSGTSIVPDNSNGVFVGGEPLIVKLTTPGYSSFVNVDYYSLDGHVVHMLPSVLVSGNQAPANYTATLGDLDQWIVSEPYGKELIVILTTPKQLFSDLRKDYEKASDYLDALNAKLASLDDETFKQQITADFVFIDTRAK